MAALTRRGRYHLYMLQCADGTYYSGSTNDLEARIKLHNSGNGAKYLRGRGPARVVYVKEYRYYRDVVRAERNLKKLTRKEKEALIRIHTRSKQPPVPGLEKYRDA